MVVEMELSEAEMAAVATEGRDDGFNIAPIELMRMLSLGRDRSVEAKAYYAGGELVAVSGLMVESMLSDTAHIWMISTSAVARHKIAFMRHAKRLLARFPYRRLTCFCDPSFARTHKWLEAEGFRRDGQVHILGRWFWIYERTA